MSNLKAAVGEKEAAIIRKRLNAWAKSCNTVCADCPRTNPTWASVNLGVLVCLECAGRHRSLGTHISKMRSITLDTVLPEEANFLLHMTNELANRYWEANLSPAERAKAQSQGSFIEQKYTYGKWALQDRSIPAPSRDCVPQSHPWWSAPDTNGAAAASSAPPAPPAASQPAAPTPVVVVNSAPPVCDAADLIDFGESPKQAAVAPPPDSDPFATAEAPRLQTGPPASADVSDPFAIAASVPQLAAPPAPPPAAPAAPPQPSKPPQAPIDPFAALSIAEPSHTSQVRSALYFRHRVRFAC